MALKNSYKSFIEDSDPVHDMGIGMDVAIKDWVENETYYSYIKKNLLWICAEYGKTEFVKYLLDREHYVHVYDDQALRYASLKGHTEIVKLLLDAGADVHAFNDEALRYASIEGHTEIVKLLLDAGADVHADKDYALRRAAYKGHNEIVKLLKDHIAKEKKIVKESITHFKEDSDPIEDMDIGAYKLIKDWAKDHVKSSNYDDNDLLWLSASYGKLEYVEYLINYGYDVHYQNDKALSFASLNGHEKIVKLLLDAGADVHANNEKALRWASSYGNHEVVKVLLDAGADIHVNKDDALVGACEGGNAEVVRLLLDAGADVNTQRELPLFKASMNAHLNVVDMLIDAGADVTKLDDEWFKEMNYHGHGFMSRKLRDLKNKINNEKKNNIVKESIAHFKEESDPIRDMDIGMMHEIKCWVETVSNYNKYDENNLLWICAEHGKTEFVKYLLDKGYDVHYNDDKALRYASIEGHTETVKLLLDAGANIHADDDYALRWSAYKGHDEIVKLLLVAGANVHARNNYALRLAKANWHHNVVKLLQDYTKKRKKKPIKESITHFTEDSDPVQDMEIGMDEIIKNWVKNETNYEYEYHKNDLLDICAEAGKTEFVKYLLDKGHRTHINRALRWASGDNYIEIVKLLLDAGADVHAQDDQPLRLASQQGHVEVVKLLLDAGANVHAQDDQPLRLASQQGHVEVVKLLLDAGANVHAENDAPLCITSCNGHTEIVKMLIDAGANVRTQDNEALRWASYNGHTEIVKLLLDAGADVYVDHSSPLRLAKEENHDEIIKLIQDHMKKEKKIVKESLIHFTEDGDPIKDMGIGMEHAIDDWLKTVEEYDDYYSDPDDKISIAARRGKLDFVKYLVRNGHNKDKALRMACYGRQVDVVKFLLDAGADVHTDDNYGLIIASEYGYPEIVKLLIDAGAEVQVNGNEALKDAAYNGHTEVVKLLLDAGADVHAHNEFALIWASEQGHFETVKVLLKAGADPYIANKKPLRMARKNKHIRVIMFLKNYMKKEKKIVKESLIHFTEDGDPIKDMGIGVNPKVEAKKFMEETRGGLINYIAEIYFNNRKKEGAAWVLYSFFNGILKGMDPQDAFYKAAEYENYHGSRPDIVAARKEITDAIKKRHYIDIDYDDPRL